MIGESFQPKIADPLRNESIEITCRYAHVFPSTQKEVASKLDDMMADIQAFDLFGLYFTNLHQNKKFTTTTFYAIISLNSANGEFSSAISKL